MRTEPRERDGVRADVALQMHAALADHLAEQRDVEAHHVADVVGLGQETSEAIVG